MKKGPRFFFCSEVFAKQKKRCAIHYCDEWDEPEASAALFLAAKRCLPGQVASATLMMPMTMFLTLTVILTRESFVFFGEAYRAFSLFSLTLFAFFFLIS